MSPRATRTALAAALLCLAALPARAAFTPPPPPTRAEIVRDTLHGVPF